MELKKMYKWFVICVFSTAAFSYLGNNINEIFYIFSIISISSYFLIIAKIAKCPNCSERLRPKYSGRTLRSFFCKKCNKDFNFFGIEINKRR